MDKIAIREFDSIFMGSQVYDSEVAIWKKPLEKKKLRRERKKLNPPTIFPDEESGEGLVAVHDEARGIILPPHPDQMYAVVNIKGIQFKVTRDARVLLEELGEEFTVGQQLVFSDVLLIGTPDYTCIGRPTIARANVYATLEERTRSNKVIVFKKKRRQGYQKSQGHKQMLNMIRIDKIEHDITEEDLVSGDL